MHELSVCHNLLEQVAAVAATHNATAVISVTLHIGPLSGVEPQLLQRAFPLARAGTVADHARLIIKSLPVRVQCKSCGAESDAAPNRLLCGQCGDYHTHLLSGDEMLLASMELDKFETPADLDQHRMEAHHTI